MPPPTKTQSHSLQLTHQGVVVVTDVELVTVMVVMVCLTVPLDAMLVVFVVVIVEMGAAARHTGRGSKAALSPRLLACVWRHHQASLPHHCHYVCPEPWIFSHRCPASMMCVRATIFSGYLQEDEM